MFADILGQFRTANVISSPEKPGKGAPLQAAPPLARYKCGK
jgi:hypothetical protein